MGSIEEIDEMISEVDINKDREVDYDEFISLWESQRPRPRESDLPPLPPTPRVSEAQKGSRQSSDDHTQDTGYGFFRQKIREISQDLDDCGETRDSVVTQTSLKYICRKWIKHRNIFKVVNVVNFWQKNRKGVRTRILSG